MSEARTKVRIHGGIGEIGRRDWDACVPTGPAYNPFISFDFLECAEMSGCVSSRTGWSACHLSVESDGGVAGVMPLYLKSHSQGEYVFDHGWAEAYERAGGRYYPKLLSASPFSPVTGPRLLVRDGCDTATVRNALLGGAVQLMAESGASSLHVTFPTESEWRWMGGQGLLLRQDQQFQWRNTEGWQTFDDFLASLSSSHRKIIRRERREATQGLEVVALSGDELTTAHWDAFFAFYMDTGARKWGRPYLNRRFFSLLHERMRDQVLLIMARRDGDWIAGALNLIGGDCLYGRNWGALDHVPFLHFELCYYRAIEEALKLGLPRVEAGAQGAHKIARGYLPSPVYSAHAIADPALRAPVARYLDQERSAMEVEMAQLRQEFSPFRQRP
ncbi:MAG: family N-acetyltransferase [Caulobacteraceae bacterium]|nr:family N-acetyltransferase [Caulobacteraceae bacterium]